MVGKFEIKAISSMSGCLPVRMKINSDGRDITPILEVNFRNYLHLDLFLSNPRFNF